MSDLLFQFIEMEQPRLFLNVACDPPKSTAQQNVRIFKGKSGKATIGKSRTNAAAAAQRLLKSLFRSSAPEEPLKGPLKVSVRWRYAFRKSEPQKNRFCDIPCNTRPDVDNLQKGFFDVLTKLGYWEDDAQIADVRFVKVWGSEPGITLIIETLT